MISFTGFADELEKIAKTRMHKLYDAGKLSIEEMEPLLRKYTPTEPLSKMTDERFARLAKIKQKRYMAKGMDERTALDLAQHDIRMNKGGIEGIMGRRGGLRGELEVKSHRARGGPNDKESQRAVRKGARTEAQVMSGDVKTEYLTRGLDAYRDDHLSAAAKIRKSMGELAHRENMEPGFRKEVLRAERSGKRMRAEDLKRETERLGISSRVGTPEPNTMLVRGNLRKKVERDQLEATRQKGLEKQREAAAAKEQAYQKSVAELDQRNADIAARSRQLDAEGDELTRSLKQQQEQWAAERKLRQQQTAQTSPPQQPAPQQAPPPQQTPPPATTTPTPAPAEGGSNLPLYLGIGAGATALGAGGYALHRRRQTQMAQQQAQQGGPVRR